MALSFCVLGSGSAGNCTLVLARDGVGARGALIDAGLSPRQTARRLEARGVDVDQIDDVLLTHLDRDHLHAGWSRVAGKRSLRVHVHRRHRRPALSAGVPVRCLHVFEQGFRLAPGLDVAGVLLAHDQLGTVGYVIEHRGVRLGLATDLGRVGASLMKAFVDLDGLALESNYDRQLQLNSERPPFLKHRIMSGLGHLSNEEALDAVLAIERQSSLRHIALLHLSQQCNDPHVLKQLYVRRAPHLLDRLTISSQHGPTPMLDLEEPAATRRTRCFGEQMDLFAEEMADARAVR